MLTLEDELRPWSFQRLCAADSAAGTTNIIIDVEHDSQGRVVASLERLLQKVEKLLTDERLVTTTKKLYIVGAWNIKQAAEEQDEVGITIQRLQSITDASAEGKVSRRGRGVE